MTVAELIEKLQQFDPSLRVIIPGYQGGYNDLDGPVLKKIALNFYDEWYYGKHEQVTEYRDCDGCTQEDAVLID